MNSSEYLYVAEIVGFGVKVGVSSDPAKRLQAHRVAAEGFGRSLGRTWVSETAHTNARRNERTLMGDSPREYIAGADFASYVDWAKSLPQLHDVSDREPFDLAAMTERLWEHSRRQSRDAAVEDLVRWMFENPGESIPHLEAEARRHRTLADNADRIAQWLRENT